MVAGYFDSCYGGNELGGCGADLLSGRGECAQGQLLDFLLDVAVEAGPSFLDLT